MGTRAQIDSLAHRETVQVVTFSSDGKTLASGMRRGVELWDASEWQSPRPHELARVSGDEQQGPPGALLESPLVVEVRDQYGHVIAGAPVTFAVTEGDGRLDGSFTISTRKTDADGRAETLVALGPNPGTTTVEARLFRSDPVTFGLVTVETPDLPAGVGDYRKWHLPDRATFRLGKGSPGRAAFSPDGRRLAVPSSIGLWLYDVATAREVALLPADARVGSAVFSSDGATLAAASLDGTFLLWDAASGKIAATPYGADGGIRSVALSPDRATLATMFDFRTELWDVASREHTATLNGGAGATAFSPDGTILATVRSGDSVWLWDVATGATVGILRDNTQMESVAFSPDGETLATGSRGLVKLWDVDQGRAISTLAGHTGLVGSVAFSPDGATLAAGSWTAVALWDVASRTRVGTLDHSNEVRSVSFSPDGAALVSVSWEDVLLWDLATERAAHIQGHRLGIDALALSPDGATLATRAADVVRLWDVSTGAEASAFESVPGRSVTFSPDGSILAVGDAAITLWDLASNQSIATLDRRDSWPATSLAFSPDGSNLAAGYFRGDIQLWDVANRRGIAALQGHTALVSSVAFSPDGATLASGSWDATARLWDLGTRQEIGTPRPGTSVAFSADGAFLAVADRNRVRLLDPETWREVETFRASSPVYSPVFSPDGAILAVGSGDGAVLWEMETRRSVATLEGHTGQITSLAFLLDGATLATGSGDGTVLLWDLTPRPHGLAIVSGDGQEGNPGRLLPDSLVVEVWDLNGDRLPGAQVTFAVTRGDGTLSTETATTDARGRAATALTLGKVPGPGTVEVAVADLEPVIFTAHTRSVPTTLSKVGGEDQQGPSGEPLAQPFVVSVLDQSGEPLASTPVTFAVTGGGGTLAATTATTDAEGRAASTLTLGQLPGINTVEVTVAELPPVTFNAVGTAVPRSLTRLSGDAQQAGPGEQLEEPLVVSVADQNGTAFPGAVVTFAVTAGAGTLSANADTTDAEGKAAIFLTLGEVLGTSTVTARVSDLDPVTFTATAEAKPDFDGDGTVGFEDFFLFAEAFGGSDPRFDLDGSGSVDFADFFLFAEHFGQPAQAKLVALARELIGLPDGPLLQQNAPNPFNSGTVISWFQLQPGPARVEVFALTGQRVVVLGSGHHKAGLHRLHWNGRDDQGRPSASGIYLYRLLTAKGAQTRKLTLLR